ncbi:MAG: hypothetical protein Q9202_005483 [Teloschistes flavicans]
MDPKTSKELNRLRRMPPTAVYEEAGQRRTNFHTDYSKGDPFYYRPSMRRGYNFRHGVRHPSLPQPSDPVDEDKSENFGIEAPAPQYPQLEADLKRKREEQSLQAGEPEQPTERKSRLLTWRNGRLNGRSLPIVLKLTSESGRQLLACGTNNWPEPNDELRPRTYEARWLQSIDEENASDPARFLAPYMLRSRKGCTYDDIDDERVDSSELTLGHPEARGCIPCSRLGLPCSLIEEGSTYPCQTCVEDSCDCELVIEPPVKRSCQGCRRRRLNCSYLEADSDHTAPCRTCDAIDEKCIAGPASGRTRDGPSLDQPIGGNAKSTSKPPRQRPISRQFVSCTLCRQDKKRCSLRHDEDPPCNRCKTANTTCDFESLKPSSSKKTKSSHEQTNQLPPIPALPSRSRLFHPIRFNYEPPENSTSTNDDSLPCHFCCNPLYGLLGRDFHPPSRNDSNPSTHVCVSCTLERMQILACPAHVLLPLPSMHRPTFDFGRVDDWLLTSASTPGPHPAVDWEWCTLCPSPAAHACRCPFAPIIPPPNAEAETADEGNAAKDKGPSKNVQGQGCGLRVCELCAAMFDESLYCFDSLVEQKVAEGDTEGDECRVRADAEVLLPEGSLARAFTEFELEGMEIQLV